MIKCKYCIFEFDSMCKNPESDDYGKNVFIAYDGCNNGKRNTVGISKLQRIVLMREANQTGGENE